MLVIEPIRRVPACECKIPLEAEPPQNIATSGTIGIVNLDNPTLVTHRKKKIAVGCVGETVGVCPIGELKRMAIDVQMVEGTPDPHGLVILVHVDNCVAYDCASSRKAGHVLKISMFLHQ